MSEQIGKLIDKLERACKGEELAAVFPALGDIIEGVIEQMPESEFRNHMVMRLLYTLLSASTFHDVELDFENDSTSLASITDTSVRNATALGCIRAIINVSTQFSSDDDHRKSLILLQRSYAPPKSGIANLLGRLYTHAITAAFLVRCLPEGGDLIKIIAMYVQAVLSAQQFKDVEVARLKEVLRSVAEIPTEEFRSDRSFEHILNFADEFQPE